MGKMSDRPTSWSIETEKGVPFTYIPLYATTFVGL